MRPRGVVMKMLLALAVVALTPLAAPGQQTREARPRAITVAGHTLELRGHGTREELFVDLYSVSLYLPRRFQKAAEIWDAAVPKALRAEIIYDGSLPDKIPTEWKSELLPPLTPEQQQRLRAAYQRLGPGDTIRIAYAPEAGTTVTAGNEVVLRDRSDDLMRAFLDLWAGRTPVSEELRGQLL